MATDAWQATRNRVLELWRRVQPARADATAVQLDSSHEDVLAAGTDGDQQTVGEVRAQWQGLFRRLLAAHPEAERELRALLDDLGAAHGPALPSTVQHATASGHARVYQAGRDQHVTER
ncbi:hypothetical protein [Actinacidiphila yeochonensis]|uniref:hypothetical protein n=1 Tax=Actinacidiphila yeochonensis TaxID=89050 RepID=UPI001E5B61DF|nr:hypothetical protein [Actinacidiphila yeochonensis]